MRVRAQLKKNGWDYAAIGRHGAPARGGSSRRHGHPDTPGTAGWADRQVNIGGRIHICHAKIYVGKWRAGQTLHVLFDATTI